MNINKIVDLKIPEVKKYSNDCQWFKDVSEYLVPTYSAVVDNYEKMQMNYEIVNNDLAGFKTQLDNFCSNTMSGEIIPDEHKEELLPYNKLYNKKNVLIGELLKRTDDHKAILMSSNAVKRKNEQLMEALQASINEMLEIEQMKAQMQQQGASNADITEAAKQERSQKEPEELVNANFLTEWEIFYNKAIKYAYFDQDVKTKKAECFEDVIVADRCVIYSGWKYGKPHIEIVNPLYFGFHKSPNTRYIQNGDYAWYKKSITIADALQEYGNQLTEAEIEQLTGETYTTSIRDKRHDVLGKNAEYMRDMQHYREFRTLEEDRAYADKRVGTHQEQGINRNWTQEHYVWRTHIEYKAFREIGFLTYLDDYNEEITEIVDSKFEVPKEHLIEDFYNDFGEKTQRKVWEDEISGRQFSLELLWIPRRYEVTRLGENIYVDCREVPNQPLDIDNPYSNFELSYKGAVFTDRNAQSISKVERAIPFQFQYFYIKHIQNKELAKYRAYIQSIDLDQIPDELGLDEDGEPIRDKVATYLKFLKDTNIDLYSGAQSSHGGLAPATRSPGSTGYSIGAAAELLNLQQLLEFIDREISITMGITPQREGAFSSNSNVTDNRQAITQSHHITEIYFYKLNEIWKAVLNDYLRNFVTYLRNFFKNHPNKKEHFIHYVLPDGTEELLEVTPKMLEHTDLGIWISNNSTDIKYNEMMMQLVHAFAQNAGEGVEAVSSILKAITNGTSPEETHKLIQKEAKKQQDRVTQQQQQMAEAEERKLKMEIEAREDVQKHEIDKILIEQRERRLTELAKAEISSEVIRKGEDVNDNQVPDELEIEKVKQAGELERAKLAHDATQRELDRQVKRQDIKSKEKIARSKPNNSSSSK